MKDTLTYRYANALVDIAENDEELLAWEKELLELAPIFEETEIKNFFYSNAVEADLKKEILEKVNKKVGFSDKIYYFLKILVDKGNFNLFPAIAESFTKSIDEKLNREKFVVKLAYPVDEKSKQNIEKKLALFTSKPPEISYQIDEKILGGFVAESDDLLIDGSTKTHLGRLRKKILQG